MADINYGQLADAIVGAIERSRAVGQADDPVAILSRSLTQSVETAADQAERQATKLEGTEKDLLFATNVVKMIGNTIVKTATRLASEVLVLQRQGLAFNKDFTQTMATAGSRIEGLPGGLQQSLTSLFEFQRSGMFRAGKETLALANTMRITGQNTGQLVNLDKMLLNQGLLGSTQRDMLIERLGTTATSYGVAADGLVESLNNLAQSLPLLGLTGGAGSMTAAMTKFSAEFPALAGQMGQLVNEVVGSVQSNDFGGIQRLGLEDLAQDIISGRDVNLAALARKAAEGTRTLTGGGIGSQGMFAIGAQMNLATNIGVLGSQIEKQMGLEKKRTGGKTVSQLGADFMTALNEALEPFQIELGKVVTNIAKWLGEFAGFMKSIGGIKVVGYSLIAVITGKLIVGMLTLTRALAASSLGKGIGNMLPWLLGGKGKGAGMLGRVLGSPLGAIAAATAVVAIGMPMLVEGLTGVKKTNAEQLAVMKKSFERESNNFRLNELGRSRFEEVSKMLINESLAAAGSGRVAVAEMQQQGFASLSEKSEEIRDQIAKRRAEAKTPVVPPRSAQLNPGTVTT